MTRVSLSKSPVVDTNRVLNTGRISCGAALISKRSLVMNTSLPIFKVKNRTLFVDMQNPPEFELAIALVQILAFFLPAWGIVIGIFVQVLGNIADKTVLVVFPIGFCFGISASVLYIFGVATIFLIDALLLPGMPVEKMERVRQAISSMFILVVLFLLLALIVLALRLYIVLGRRNMIRVSTIATGISLPIFDFWRFFISPVVDGAVTIPTLMFTPTLVGVVLIGAVSLEVFYNRHENIPISSDNR